ncbi:MAG: hypothetical protein ACREQQ_00505, partial [Candidatus Binatia bacterium]
MDGAAEAKARGGSTAKSEHRGARPQSGADDLRRVVVNQAPVVLWAFDRNGVFTLIEGKGLTQLGD